MGKIGGRRFYLAEGHEPALVLPPTEKGRALARLLGARQAWLPGQAIRIPWRADIPDVLRGLAGLIEDLHLAAPSPPAATATAAVRTRLIGLGVYHRLAAALAADSWVTLERIEGWWAVLAGAAGVRLPAAVLVSRLRAHEEPPHTAAADTRAAADPLPGEAVLSPVQTRLEQLGIYRRVAARLAEDAWVTLARIDAWWQRLAADPGVVSPAAVLVGALDAHEEPELEPVVEPLVYTGRHVSESSLAYFAPGSCHAAPSAPHIPPEIAVWWQTAYGDLQLQMPRETFDTWLRTARLLDHQDGVFTIGVESAYARDWLTHRLNRVVERTLRQITGNAAASVRYVALHDESHQPLPADQAARRNLTYRGLMTSQAPLVEPGLPAEARAWWLTAYGDLQLQMPRETFDTWVRTTRLLNYEDGTFVLGVENSYARDWLEHRLSKVILRTLRQITCNPNVVVRYVNMSVL